MTQVLWPLEYPNHKAFTTIDDVIRLSEELYARLSKIGGYKHPLAVRRGVKFMAAQIDSKTIKAGATTYFLDIKHTRDNKPYLLITESRFKGEGDERERKTIFVFQESAKEFAQALSELVNELDR